MVAPRPIVRAAARPLRPPLLRVRNLARRIEALGGCLVRRMPREHEGHPIARPHHEFRDRGQALTTNRHSRVQANRIGTRHGRDAVARAAHPRHDGAVVEPDDQLGSHRDLAADALDQTNDVGIEATGRHAVGEPHDPGVGFELGLEHERPVAIPAPCLPHGVARGDEPAAMLGRSEQCSEARARVEPREAEPVDRPVAADQRGRLRVSDEGVVFDAE